ncbi:class I SAM-dependent methyltransferase [Xylanibacillus composti]|uniref:Methyltransferase n=1 Tax=Xylanibacillus composti TaxID=1572762 RepID=A0A8J4H4Z9_9BACL|nr:class I SAM-dependent methyltransferase [Xylanibacillus composti]MDT9724469.1 class I SAM-dependent methyltransferase [Xylanibacillus composti]GIQ69731.1 methyltransferase [Xylanibacillus composti]
MAYNQFAYVYDRLMAEMPYDQWVGYAEAMWELLGKPVRIADIGCGTGNITIPLALKGYELTGLDLSKEMLQVAAGKWEATARQQPFGVTGTCEWQQQDARNWRLPEPTDAVISFCDCLNYLLEPEELKQAFHCAYEALKPGGTFLFDLHHPRQLQAYAEEQPFIWNEPDLAYLWACLFDEERCQVEHQLTIFRRCEGDVRYERIDEIHRQRTYEPEVVVDLLRDAGFGEVLVHADFTMEAPEEHAQRVFYTAVK